MGKLKDLIAFDVMVAVLYVASSLWFYNIINTEQSHFSSTGTSIVQFGITPFTFSVSRMYFGAGGATNLGPIPAILLNVPFLLFWVLLIGNMLFFAWAMRKKCEQLRFV
jgi:hypothetical protein